MRPPPVGGAADGRSPGPSGVALLDFSSAGLLVDDPSDWRPPTSDPALPGDLSGGFGSKANTSPRVPEEDEPREGDEVEEVSESEGGVFLRRVLLDGMGGGTLVVAISRAGRVPQQHKSGETTDVREEKEMVALGLPLSVGRGSRDSNPFFGG